MAASKRARGRVSIVRYADDFVVGPESAADGRRMLVDLKKRLVKFGLLLDEDEVATTVFRHATAGTH
jgi:RNA-directed DNA polymerase